MSRLSIIQSNHHSGRHNVCPNFQSLLRKKSALSMNKQRVREPEAKRGSTLTITNHPDRVTK